MPNPQQLKMEDMSEAYLRALCAVNGFNVSKVNHDNDGYDVEIACKGKLDPSCKLTSPKLDIQLKASYSNIIQNPDRSITFDLEVKNYKWLIDTSRITPLILVVFHMHKDESTWLYHTMDWLKITKCAYWISLRGKAPTKNKSKIRIKIPSKNVLNAQSLRGIMFNISNALPL